MTTTMTARALTPIAPSRSPHRSILRRAVRVAVAFGLVVSAVGVVAATARGAPSAATGSAGTPTAQTAGRVPAPSEAPRRRPPPGRLDPHPPPDGRDAPDPFILRDGGRYFLYTTQVWLLNVPVAMSTDLISWSPAHDAFPELPAWAEWGRTWAPGVLRRGTAYVLYFAARSRALGVQCIGVAVADAPEGPFVSRSPDPLVCQPELGGSIDPSPFVDRDGAAYLLWKADGNAIGRVSTLFGQRLRPDGLGMDGPAAAMLRSDAPWEQPLVENPTLTAAGPSSYLLLYSGGWWESAGYATGYATCQGPLGPCTKATRDEPLLATGGQDVGPGGASLVTGPAGDHWLAYHAWPPGAVGYAAGGVRSLRFASLRWDGATPTVAR